VRNNQEEQPVLTSTKAPALRAASSRRAHAKVDEQPVEQPVLTSAQAPEVIRAASSRRAHGKADGQPVEQPAMPSAKDPELIRAASSRRAHGKADEQPALHNAWDTIIQPVVKPPKPAAAKRTSSTRTAEKRGEKARMADNKGEKRNVRVPPSKKTLVLDHSVNKTEHIKAWFKSQESDWMKEDLSVEEMLGAFGNTEDTDSEIDVEPDEVFPGRDEVKQQARVLLTPRTPGPHTPTKRTPEAQRRPARRTPEAQRPRTTPAV